MNNKKYFLSDLYTMDSGISTTPEQAGHGFPFVSYRDIYNNEILPDEPSEKMDTSESERRKYSIKNGDILLTRTSETLEELAMTSVAIKDYPNTTYTGFAKRLRPKYKDITYPKFMAFYLRSDYFRKVINCKAVMTLRASFNEDIFSYIELELPDFEEQKKYGDLFWLIEEKIRNNKKIISNIEKLNSLIYDYWFNQYNFPNLKGAKYKKKNGDMVWNEQLKRHIPSKWKVVSLIDEIEWQGTSQPPKSEFVYEYKEGYIRFIQNRDYEDNKHITYIPYKKNTKVCDCKDIMMDKYGDAGKIRFGIQGAYNVALAKIKVNDNFKKEYIRAYLGSYPIYKYLHESCVASTRASLNEYNLSYLPILMPENYVLKEFEKKVGKNIDIILKLKKENEELIYTRNFLLPLFMSGQATM